MTKLCSVGCFGHRRPENAESFVEIEKKMAEGAYDPVTCNMMQWYICEERDSGKKLREAYAKVRARANGAAKMANGNGAMANGNGAMHGPSADAQAIMACMTAGFARLVYKDDRGAVQTFPITKDEIVIGRQAPDVWADLSLDTSLYVSREHARIQRTPEGAFRIKDLSKLGTTVNGVAVPRSLESTDGGVRDLDRWEPLPDRARIGLAGVIYLDFERLAKA